MELKQPYASVVFSAPGLKQGENYAIYAGDQQVVAFTLENKVTWLTESGVTMGRPAGQGWRR